jgi:hypothetical protein
MDQNETTETTIKRKPGRPVGTGTGRKADTRSISMLVSDWDRFDLHRGAMSRGKWILFQLDQIQSNKS